MAKNGPIVIIEDDADDKELFDEVLKDLGIKNKLVWFTLCEDAMAYLRTTSDQPFLIFSDINLPKQSGIEFKKVIDADPQLRKKSIPFVFFSTTANQHIVNEAYTEMIVQGFFKKPDQFADLKQQIKIIHDYWSICKHPNMV